MSQTLPLFPDLPDKSDEPTQIVPGRKLSAIVTGLFAAPGSHFETVRVDRLDVDILGIRGDVHAGLTRRSGGREPWYRRGTEVRNERQVSIVAADELATVAQRMNLAEIRPEWIGANLLLGGVPHLSMLPAGTMLFFKNGATIKIDGQNAPCRLAGRQVAKRAGLADVEAGALDFAKMAKRLRGLVGWIEKPGIIADGEEVSVRVPEQWIYRP